MSSYLLISDAAREVNVETHVLRYWEEELQLPIKRNELGHRYYTTEDVERFKRIKSMKENGLQLKAIKMILKDGTITPLGTEHMAINIVGCRDAAPEPVVESGEEKAKRLQWLLCQMIREALRENNQELCREMKESIIKEMDYQFRMQEERTEERERERDKRNEEYYRRVDELLRKKNRKLLSGKSSKEEQAESANIRNIQTAGKKGKKKRHSIF